jgi:hypothetical protein
MNELQVEGELSAVVAPPATQSGSPSICIGHSGRSFVTAVEQAGLFLRRLHVISARRITALVPLLRSGGVDLLLVSAASPLQVHDVLNRSCESQHRR